MVKRHGRKMRAWIAGYRISPDVSQIDEQRTGEVGDVSALEDDDRVYVTGVSNNSFRLTGFFNDAIIANGDSREGIDEILGNIAALGNAGNDVLIVHENVQNAPTYAGEGGLATGYTITGPNAGPVTIGADMLFSGVARRGQVNSAYGTVSIAGTSPVSYDVGAGTAPDGFMLAYQWDQIEGTVQVITYMGLSDGAETTPVGTVVMTEAGGAGGTAITVLTAGNRYYTDVWSLPGGTGTAAWISSVAKIYALE